MSFTVLMVVFCLENRNDFEMHFLHLMVDGVNHEMIFDFIMF